MLLARTLVLFFPIAMSFAACQNEGPAAPLASPTVVAPISLTQPIDPRAAFPGTSSLDEPGVYILDVETGTLRGISTPPGQFAGLPQWDVGGDALLFNVASGTYRMGMAGDVRLVSNPTPRAIHASNVSGDGLWQSARGAGGLQLVPSGPLAEGLRPAYGLYEWSPVGHLLASWGGPCGGGLEVIDAATMDRLPLPSEVRDSAVGISWTQSGNIVAVAVRDGDAGLVLVSLDNPRPRRPMSLGVIATTGLPLPTGFSASGRYLLLTKLGGYDCSN